MLYNPELYKAPSLRDMADFCDSKDPKEAYVFQNASICACGQYSHAKGMKGANWLDDHSSKDRPLWSELNTIAGMGEHTFGALAKRLRQAANA